MVDKNYNSINGAAEQTDNNTPYAEHTERGALELEYPNGNGLYGELFNRYLPEVANGLVDTRAVRMLVELEFNCRRVQRMFLGMDGIGAKHITDLEETRRSLESLLWDVCDSLSYMYRIEWEYIVPGPAHEWQEDSNE